MYPSLMLSAALIAPAAPIPRDTVPHTTGPAPYVLAVKGDTNGTVRVVGTILMKVTVTNTHFIIEMKQVNGKQVQQQVQKQVEQDVVTTNYFNKTLADLNGKFMTADGTPLTVAEATGRVKRGATLLASADGKPVAKTWLRAVDGNTVVVVADGLASFQQTWSAGEPYPNTPAPRLAVLGTNDDGKVLVPTATQTANVSGIYYGNDVMIRQGFGGRRAFRGEYGYYPPQPTATKVVLKPLADVKFDAFDVTGKRVSKRNALKRLAAGGLVIIAGDSTLPDENYLKAFREDVLVLTGPELVLPVTPVDKTKKKDPNAKPVAPMAPVVRPLPIIRGGGLKRQVILPVAPAKQIEKK